MIGFRVDANEEIATGHLMRCIAIASACVKRGEEVLFFLAENKETERLEARGLSYRILHSDWRHMEQELEMLPEILAETRMDWLVVDSYQATEGYLEGLQQYVKVLYVDDYGEKRYPISAVLNYSLFVADRRMDRLYAGSGTQLLLGGDYVPLREEFSAAQEGKREQSVLITTGGTDTYNVTGRVLRECVGRERWRGVSFHVIVGSMNAYRQDLQALAEEYPCILLHSNVTNMSYYMRTCRVAVSAGGTTLCELCACGIPAVCFSFADNQRGGTEAMGSRDVMLYAGDARTSGRIAEEIEAGAFRLMSDAALWNRYSQRMRQLVDGMGAERIADFLQG